MSLDRADHIFIRRMARTLFGGKVSPTRPQLDRISGEFRQAGGSWVKLFQGSVDEIERVRDLLVAAHKAGQLRMRA